MEWKFRLNWAAIVEEARHRRKSQKLTQRRLAELAGVSTPTISRFENGEKDIQLSSATSVLGVLGMLDERTLVFPGNDARLDTVRDVVVFEGMDGQKTLRCAISREALEDHFNGGGKDLLKVFRLNRDRIEHEARRKYLAGHTGLDELVLIETADLS